MNRLASKRTTAEVLEQSRSMSEWKAKWHVLFPYSLGLTPFNKRLPPPSLSPPVLPNLHIPNRFANIRLTLQADILTSSLFNLIIPKAGVSIINSKASFFLSS